MGKIWYDAGVQEILLDAVRLSRNLGHSFVGSEHILLALSARPESAELFDREKLSYSLLYQKLLLIRGKGERSLPLPQGLTPKAKELLRIALRLGQPVHPNQLFSAITRQKNSTARLLLLSCGVEKWNSPLTDSLPREKRGTMRLLEQFGVNMLEKAKTGAPVICREEEIELLTQVLCRKHKNNPALVGDPGVGKTAIVEGLAQRMVQGDVPPQLHHKRLYSLDTASMVAGTKYRGEFEERVRDLVQEVSRQGDVILFVDEMHTLVGAGAAEGAIDAANILKPALSRGTVQLIGATTSEEYRKCIEKDGALERRFRKIRVAEPSAQQTVAILQGLKPGLERHHGITITQEAIEAAVALSQRYLHDYFLPDKALDLLDEGAAHSVLTGGQPHPVSPNRQALDDKLRAALAQEDYAMALAVQGEIAALEETNGSPILVTPADIAHAVSSRTGIPVGALDNGSREKLASLEEKLSRQVIGQEAAIALIADAVRRGRTGLCGQNRPSAAILLTGPTGVGKTELCRVLAREVYGSEQALIRLDMTEYTEKHTISRLVGAPPGYVGHEDGGILTEKVHRNPYSIVLFDEIDKAHPALCGLLLQIMEEGCLTDSMGRRVDFSNTILLLTANIDTTKGTGLGFQPEAEAHRQRAILGAHFTPEFLGRLDAVAQFAPLSQKSLEKIALLQLNRLRERAEKKKISIQWDAKVISLLAGKCKNDGRAIRHLIASQIEAPLARRLVTIPECSAFSLTEKDGRITVSP